MKNSFVCCVVLFFVVFGHVEAQTCGPDVAPAPAVAHGLTCEVFWDDFTSLSTVDLTDSRAPGFKWYIHNASPGHLQAPTPPGDIALVAGGLQITPSRNTGEDLFNMESCAWTGPPASYPAGWVGNAVQGSMYIDVKVSSIGALNPAAHWWTALWALGVQQYFSAFPSPVNFSSPEIDFIEYSGGGRNLHQWDIFTSGSQTDTYTSYAVTPTFVDGETLGTLILAPESNGGVGKVEGYLNDVVEGSSTPVTWSPGGTYSITTNIPLCFLITSGYQQPLVLRSFRVFAAPSSSQLTFTSP